MTSRQHATPSAHVAKCPKCGGLPRYVEHFGRTLAETMDFSVPAHRHSLECACGRATGKHTPLPDATSDDRITALLDQLWMAYTAPNLATPREHMIAVIGVVNGAAAAMGHMLPSPIEPPKGSTK